MPRVCAVYQFGPFRLDTSEHRLLRNGVEVPLQLKTFETLCALIERAGHLLTKEDLLCYVWPGTVVEENNLNKNISILRKVLGYSDSDVAEIKGSGAVTPAEKKRAEAA